MPGLRITCSVFEFFPMECTLCESDSRRHVAGCFLSPAGRRWLGFLAAVCVACFPTGARSEADAGAARSRASAGNVREVAQSELGRRARLVEDATALLAEGDLLASEGSLEGAMVSYSEAVQTLPLAPATKELRGAAVERFSEVSVRRARELQEEGYAQEAIRFLEAVIEQEMNPGYEPARELLADFADPEIVNPARTPEHVRDVAEVESLLLLAGDLANSGQYDLAKNSYQRILRIDPYNSAARKGMLRVDEIKNRYLQDARAQTRANALAEVDASWESSLPPVSNNLGRLFGAREGPEDRQAVSVSEKLTRIVLPKVQFIDVTLAEAVEFLSLQSRQYDTTTPDSDRKGVSIVVAGGPDFSGAKVTLDVRGVPLDEVLRYVADQAGMRHVVERYAVRLVPLGAVTEGLVTRVFRVPPDFIQSASGQGDAGGAAIDPFAPVDQGSGGVGQLRKRLGAREFLENRGIAFPEGAAADFSPGTSTLMVRNTQDAVDLVETLVDQARSRQPKQVEIRVTMLEIRQDTLGELGYDWLVAPFNVGGSEKVFGAGGVSGNSDSVLAGGNYPFQTPDGSIIGQQPITGGLRGLSELQRLRSVDNLLGTGSISTAAGESPGVFAVAGVFTDPQFQVVMRALSQSTGTDLMTAPRTLAKSGQRAKIELIREFIYPTEFDPPEIPESVGVLTVDSGIGGITDDATFAVGDGFAPITPATPTAFEARSLGVTLEVEPVIGEDNRTVDLNIVPEFVEFLGFIDYGSDITQVSQASGGNPIVTQNDILQPIFRKNALSTSVTVWDGHTIVIGGLLSEEAKQIEDDVPLLGSLPGFGHFFRSQASDIIRRNLVFFVTVNIVDPGGKLLNAPLARE